MTARAQRFPLFDSFRAVAILMVVIFHVTYLTRSLEGSAASLEPYAARFGQMGVTIFFVVSAFLLYRPFVVARLGGERIPHVGAYAWRRFLRIFPGYWVALTIVALVLARPGVFTTRGVFVYYGMNQAYHADTAIGGIGQAWSLCVELAFYAFLPLWAVMMRVVRRGGRRAVLTTEVGALVVLVAASIAYKVWVLGFGDPNSPGDVPLFLSLPTYLDDFAMGMALAVGSAALAGRDELPRVLRPLDRWPGVAWLVAAVAFWVAATQLGTDGHLGERITDGQYLGLHALYMPVALGLLLPGVFGDQTRGVVRRILANRVLLFIGLVSYGAFLYHVAVGRLVQQWTDSPNSLTSVHPLWLSHVLWFCVVLAGTLLAAGVSYYLLERPALGLKGRVGRASVPADQPGAVSAPSAPPELARPG